MGILMSNVLLFYEITTLVMVILTVLLFFMTRASTKILGSGMITDLLNILLGAQTMFILFTAMDILAKKFDYDWLFYMKLVFQILVPVVLLYAIWSIKKYAGELKKLTE